MLIKIIDDLNQHFWSLVTIIYHFSAYGSEDFISEFKKKKLSFQQQNLTNYPELNASNDHSKYNNMKIHFPHQQAFICPFLHLLQIKMKHNIFKIRKLGDPTDTKELSESEVQQRKPNQIDSLKTSIQATNQKMLQLMTMFEGFMKSTLQNSTPSTPNSLPNRQNETGKAEKEVRDRHIEIPLPNTDTVTVEQTQKWMTEVCISAFSASFHYYLTQQMTFQQTKVFCSENVLQNLLKFTEKYKLTDKQIQNLNKHIGSKVLQYLQKKYPLTQSNDVNKALQKEVQQTNHLDFLTNDFLYSFGIMFKYSPDGNYNDMIMRVINKAIEIAQQPSSMPNTQEKEKKRHEEETNFTDFQSFMSNLFENVYDEEWMMGSRAKADRTDSQATYIAKKVSAQAQKFKYEEKVKVYTNYLIGRKISQNTLPYTEQEIKGKNLIIKSPAILRILTKWCQQLWQKFESGTYFTSKTESIQLQNPQMINPFFKWMKTAIDKRAATEKVEILKFKAQLDNNSYNQQSQFFLKHLQEDNITSIPKYQKASGKFASQMVKNLHSYITLYLNRLIHGLLTVSKNFYQKQVDKSWDDWQSPPNLITFKIGDLVRCKMSSKQKEIIKIFKEIKRISNVNPKKMKIVRIKNRLKQGTNDILINIKFNNLIICQIQLEVINKSKTKFIQCSNSFSHYIYQMKRSMFGPISELCNIWNNFEARAQQYEALISRPQDATILGVNCVEENTDHQFEKFDLPFQCNFCKKLYYHNNYIIPNKQCQKCKKYKCVKCQINSMEDPQLKKVIFKSKKYTSLSDSCNKHKQKTIPNAGVCVKIQSTSINIEVFKLTKYQGKTWLLGQRDGQLYNIKKINSQKDSDQFLDHYCIFSISINTQQFIKVTDKMAQNFSVEQYVKDSYKQQKQVLILTQIRFTVPEMINLMKIDAGYERNKRKIKRIEYASNYLNDISYFSCFESLTALNLDFNYFENMLGIVNFKLLQKLEMRDNSKLATFNKEVCELTRLQEIKINNCTIKQLPENIGDLTLLQILKMDKNKLQKLPDSICNIINLKELSLHANTITKLPQQIGKLVNLRKLIMSKNKLESVPDSIGQMVGLEILDLSYNMISSLPQTMIYFSKLETLRLEGNKLETIPSGLLSNELLKTLSLRSNQIKVLPNSFQACKSLQTLQLQINQIEQLPSSLGQCLNLQNLFLEKNKLKSIPQFLGKYKKLSSVIMLANNELTEIPSFIFNMESVTKLDISFNKITAIPASIAKLEDLTQLIINNNQIKQLIPQLTQLQNLQKWTFQSNQLQKIPSFLKDIKTKGNNPTSIGKLFQQNKIKQIQSSQFFDMMKLDIVLTSNELEAIPMGLINNKQTIKTIDFSNNNIRQIPEDIALFESLTAFNLSNNQIKIIPKVLEKLTKMQSNKLMLDGNPIEQIDCLEYCLKFGTYITKQIASKLNKDPNIKPQQPIKPNNQGNYEDDSEDDE